VTPADFQREMTTLLNDWCDRRALAPLKIVLPHYPLFNDFADEVVELTKALKTVRVQLGSTLPASEFDRLVRLLHETESALNRGGGKDDVQE
jgi:hypothetical protein